MKLGVSIYPGLKEYNIKDNLEFLRLCAKLKIDFVFTSLHMPEANLTLFEEFQEIAKLAKELKLNLITDISKPTKLNLEFLNNIYAVRLDYGFSDEDIIYLSKTYNCFIELNASTLTKAKLEKLINDGLDIKRIRASHNFYPKKYTGLSYKRVKDINETLKNLGITVMAYLPCKQKRGPVFEGLPTIEEHRNKNLTSAILELKMLGCDEVFFGDAFASEEEIKIAQNCLNENFLPVRLIRNLSKEEIEILSKSHYFRFDESDYFRRSSAYRNKYSIEAKNTVKRLPGHLTIDNNLYERYRGEISIIKQEMPSDERVNVIGQMEDCEYLWKNLEVGKPFKFFIINEKEN